MPSSTSSSDERLPAGPWGRTWVAALALAAGPLLASEVFWRQRGFRPSVAAVDPSWHLAFASIGPRSTVVIGTSRIQAALEPATWVASTGGTPPVQLSLAGGAPIPVLEHLADDPSFAGLVLVEILPLYAFDATRDPEERLTGLLSDHPGFLASPGRRAEAWLAVHVPSRLVSRRTELLPERLAKSLRRGQLPEPTGDVLHPDRFYPVDFEARSRPAGWTPEQGYPGLAYAVPLTVGVPASADELEDLAARHEAAAARIRARGGRVAYLHLPGCGERERIEAERYPRERYWDRFAELVSDRALNLGDLPAYVGFACWDGSHLTESDAPAFTRALAAELRDLVPQREP